MTTAWPALYVPPLVFAHVYAIFFLVRAALLQFPQLTGRLHALLRRRCCCCVSRQAASPASSVEPAVLPIKDVEGLPQAPSATWAVQPMRLEWTGLGCTYATPQGPKVALKVLTSCAYSACVSCIASMTLLHARGSVSHSRHNTKLSKAWATNISCDHHT